VTVVIRVPNHRNRKTHKKYLREHTERRLQRRDDSNEDKGN